MVGRCFDLVSVHRVVMRLTDDKTNRPQARKQHVVWDIRHCAAEFCEGHTSLASKQYTTATHEPFTL